MHVLGSDAKNTDKYSKTIRWCKEVFSTFRIEERCKVGVIVLAISSIHSFANVLFQVLGISPYASHKSYTTQSLAKDLINCKVHCYAP